MLVDVQRPLVAGSCYAATSSGATHATASDSRVAEHSPTPFRAGGRHCSKCGHPDKEVRGRKGSGRINSGNSIVYWLAGRRQRTSHECPTSRRHSGPTSMTITLAATVGKKVAGGVPAGADVTHPRASGRRGRGCGRPGRPGLRPTGCARQPLWILPHSSSILPKLATAACERSVSPMITSVERTSPRAPTVPVSGRCVLTT